MKTSIDTYIQGIVRDNEQYIKEGGYTSVADYLISSAENGSGYYEYFDDVELEDNCGEPICEQIDELKNYLTDHYNYIPE